MPTVAVIGLGAFGIVTLKNLLEEGYDATGIERHPYFGGLWHHTTSNAVSVLQSTVANVSSQRSCFTDFPFQESASTYPTAAEVDQYLNDFVKHFNLRPRCKLATEVVTVKRSGDAWLVATRTTDGKLTEQPYDKVVCANGPQNTPITPKLSNAALFEGRIIHSSDYKVPSDFRDKSVLVVGFGNSAVDTSTTLIGVAKTVYLSHRSGALILPRYMKEGPCFDHTASYRKFVFRDFLEGLAPQLATRFVDRMIQSAQNKEYDLSPQWKFTPTPSLLHKLPIASWTLIEHLESGAIQSVPAILEVTGPRQVKLTDGQLVSVDDIIFCTGHRTDYSFLGRCDPTLLSPNSTEHDYAVPRLYQNVLSLEYPESLAFAGAAITYVSAFLAADLSAMAIAQVWKDPATRLPPKDDMFDWYSKHLEWASDIRRVGNFIPNMTEFGPWMRWIEQAAGTRVDEHLSFFSVAAWKFWWRDKKLCNLMLDAIYSPHFFRLFESPGRRKAWSGAEEAIWKVNRDAEAEMKKRLSARLHEGQWRRTDIDLTTFATPNPA